jgi:hypothetical protein
MITKPAAISREPVGIQRQIRVMTPDYIPQADLNEAALRRTHSRVAEPTVEVI